MQEKNMSRGQILTINSMGAFVNDSRVTRYNGEKIEDLDKISWCLTGDVVEIQIMQSDTAANRLGVPGMPVPDKDGRYVWMRCKSDCNVWSDWLFRASYASLNNGICFLPRWVVKDACIMTSPRRPEFREAVDENIFTRRKNLLSR